MKQSCSYKPKVWLLSLKYHLSQSEGFDLYSSCVETLDLIEYRLQTICRHHRSRRSTSPAYPGIRFHRRPTSCLRHRVPSRRVTASCDVPLTRLISHRATTPPISTARVLSPARRTNPYTSRLIPDHRRNCRVTIPCTPATGRPRLLSRRAKSLPLKKWVLYCVTRFIET